MLKGIFKMTRKKRKNKNGNGYRFEVWGERLFRRLGYRGVERNIEYHVKSRLSGRIKIKRQVDIQYSRMFKSFWLPFSLTIVEFKYRPAYVDDVVHLEETRRIIGAEYAELALARNPSPAVQDRAEKYHVRIYTPNDLRKYAARYRPFPGKTLAQQVSHVRLSEYDRQPTIKNIR